MCHSCAVDLRTWITTDLAGVQGRLHGGIVAHVPPDRWTIRLPGQSGTDGRSSSLAWLLFHCTYHHDLAVNTAVLGHVPLLEQHRSALGLTGAPPESGLPEREDPEISDALDVDALLAYADDVFDSTINWMERVAITAFDSIPEASWRIEHTAGVRRAVVPWLHDMWHGKPVSWFVQWEAVAHGYTHVGEMTGLRGALGHSPF